MQGLIAVYLRELWILRRRLKRQLAGMAVSPLLYLIAFGYAMGDALQVGEHTYLEFLIPGLVAMASMTQSFGIATDINVARFYWYIFEEFQAAPIGNWAYVGGEVLAGMTRALQALIGDYYAALLDEIVYPTFERLKTWCRDEQILQPAVVYGYFPCASAGDDLIIYDPEDHAREIERFTFPRQSRRQRRCISDFFKPVSSGTYDVVAFSIVTVGRRVSEAAREWFESDRYVDYVHLAKWGGKWVILNVLWENRRRD